MQLIGGMRCFRAVSVFVRILREAGCLDMARIVCEPALDDESAAVPVTVFTLIASLCRDAAAVEQIVESGLLSFCTRRFCAHSSREHIDAKVRPCLLLIFCIFGYTSQQALSHNDQTKCLDNVLSWCRGRGDCPADGCVAMLFELGHRS